MRYRYCEWDSFEGWFSGLSTAWQAVLAQSDEALGLAPTRGRKEAGHYRKTIVKLLTQWEQEVNEALEELNDSAGPGEKKAKLTATKKVTKGKGKAAAAPEPKAAPKRKAASTASASKAGPSSGGKRVRRGQNS